MNDYTDRILELLKGHTQHKPLRGDDLVAELRHLTPDAINAMLDDLQGRGALNRAEITKGGHTFTALWPTGMVPRATSWKEQRDTGTGISSQLAHNVQQAAEKSRQPMNPEPSPTNPEKPMVRIAQIVEDVPAEKLRSPHARRDQQMNTGPVQTAILESIKPGEVLDVNEIFSRLTIATTHGSVGKTLEMLEKRGLIQMVLRFKDKRWRRFFSLPGTEVEAAGQEPLCSELRGNLHTLSKIAADDHIADAGKAIEPETEQARRGAFDAGPLGGGDIHAADEPIATPAAHASAPENDGGTHFALFDTGTLLITSGDDFIALPVAQAKRLASYLRNVYDALYAEAA